MITAGGENGFANNENIENCYFLVSVATNLTGNKANQISAHRRSNAVEQKTKKINNLLRSPILSLLIQREDSLA